MELPLLYVIIGMAIVTYIPRLLPLILLDAKKIPPFVQAVLRNVPYAALGALIFPGVLFIHESIWFGIIGAIVAIVIAYLGANLIIVVISSIFVLFIYSSFFL
ncbi:AzlD domain-containing protein [Alkalihalobacillus sp. LMS39]|uniref:AzlD domain-containing protein n=1 Tax=Alkalihalobacillus sp. LMS39 TaxID=2924032 RepID=UPI001FB490CE|nr:AzlD domain-containing protein [Alkalihalobacillus sp. LMS39]UOE93216.1 AzlD domain-containing protein [Alkalihalobacillus sp. LMS39]